MTQDKTENVSSEMWVVYMASQNTFDCHLKMWTRRRFLNTLKTFFTFKKCLFEV